MTLCVLVSTGDNFRWLPWAPGDINHASPDSAEIKERVELYRPSGLSWTAKG